MKVFVQKPDYEVVEVELDSSTTVASICRQLGVGDCDAELFGEKLEFDYPILVQGVSPDDLLVFRKVEYSCIACIYNGKSADVPFASFDQFCAAVADVFDLNAKSMVLTDENLNVIAHYTFSQHNHVVHVFSRQNSDFELAFPQLERKINVKRDSTVADVKKLLAISSENMLACNGNVLPEDVSLHALLKDQHSIIKILFVKRGEM